MSSPNAYILGFPIEFDLLVIKNDASLTTLPFTNAYSPEHVKCAIEIKAHGLFGSRQDLYDKISKIKSNFATVKKQHSEINFVYFTFQEVTTPKRKNSINYFQETLQGLDPFKAFCIKDSREPNLIFYGQWESFCKEVIS